MKVGNCEVKNVSIQNHTVFEKAKEILENTQHQHHIGWSGVGKLVDYLETFYNLEPVDWTLSDFLNVDTSLDESAGIVLAEGKGHIAKVLLEEKHIIDGEDDKQYRVLKIQEDKDFFDKTGNHKIILERL